MKDLKEFDISFIGLKEGIHQFEYTIDKKFFDFFNYDEFYDSNVKVMLSFLKNTTIFELDFAFSGWVEVACDVTTELFHQPIEADIHLIVKFGDEYNDENEELLIIPHSENKINVAQYIYEAIVLAVPIKRIHPGVIDGSLHSEVLEKLKEFEIKDEDQEEEQQENKTKESDPRWNKLKNIQIEKNKSNGTS
ncbi:MAG: DNA-binding protein [Flavobacteria bacterium RIFCSPLOWO2_12_FULL_35_11]|nr:MAG: DNA-binding protein [Flavobacteria bacterium RIFCSPLOWO2_12_FULL_35_11]